MSRTPTTTVRLTEEDREVIEELQALTGLESLSAIIRIALREMLAKWRRKQA